MKPYLSSVRLRQLRAEGKSARKNLARSAQGIFMPTERDPVAILEEQHQTRLPALVPVRVSRMLESPFAFYRGAGAIMAHDLAHMPHTGIVSVICGDAHIANFGLFATPERRQAFELNDFDEAGTGPWEWDVKRFATSVLLAALDAGMPQRNGYRATRQAVRAYRRTLARLLGLSVLERFYYQGDARWLSRMLDNPTSTVVRDAARRARGRTSDQALERLASRATHGGYRIIDQPPIMMHANAMTIDVARDLLRDYLASVRIDVALLMSQFELVDVAIRVVGVGSVGTRCYILLFAGPSGEPLFLQVKEAQRSVLESHGRIPQALPALELREEAFEGYRVVSSQRILQSSSDPFLGYFRYDGHDYYVRQFRDMKGTVDINSLSPKQFRKYARLCAVLLARAHAQNRLAGFTSGYMGKGAVFDRTIATWASLYARQVEWDFAEFEAAVASGRLPVLTGG
jgi:uncharacterized protein (DUF2252 family)